MDESSDMFGAAPPASAETADTAPPVQSADNQPYRVLARKYRPQTFSELIGQDAMVQTLANAIRRDRLAHAFLMTGVRGVGKTSTARLIAKALNCIGPDGTGGPTIDPCGVCEPCRAIAEGRHIDVVEMDAASHTGVDDIREIIEAVRYAAVSARYKIYVIDEVHMLSRSAFNALLKTLEEPPPHVKFLFATTEVEKMPVTVLSRCQRFDLRRVPAEMLAEHFAGICTKEQVTAEPEALTIIATAAEGSVRDGLSILDQAIAHGVSEHDADILITAANVREMLGLADRSVQRQLLGAILEGNGRAVLDLVDGQYAMGVEPLALIRGLLALVHRVTVTQLSGACLDAVSDEERSALKSWAEQLSAGQLHRLWQLLLKGYEDVRIAPNPLDAVQMALLRVLHAADLPDPGDLARILKQAGGRVTDALSAPVADQQGSGNSDNSVNTAPVPADSISWGDLIAQMEQSGQMRIAQIMHDWLRVVRYEAGVLEFTLVPGYPGDPSAELRTALEKLSGGRWIVGVVNGEGMPSLREQQEEQAAITKEAIRNAPLVKAALAAFPDAQIIDDDAKVASIHAGNGHRERA